MKSNLNKIWRFKQKHARLHGGRGNRRPYPKVFVPTQIRFSFLLISKFLIVSTFCQGQGQGLSKYKREITEEIEIEARKPGENQKKIRTKESIKL